MNASVFFYKKTDSLICHGFLISQNREAIRSTRAREKRSGWAKSNLACHCDNGPATRIVKSRKEEKFQLNNVKLFKKETTAGIVLKKMLTAADRGKRVYGT